MTLPRSENLVSTMLSDTILALCRNTLQYKSEVCVEGLIGVTVDQKEVFLVHLNETILRDGGLSKSKRSDKLRKRQSEDVTDSSSESSDSKDSDSEHARSKRKRRRKRRRSKLKEVSEELAEQPKSLPTNENSQEAKDPANSDNLDKTTDSINSTRLSQPEKDSNSRNLKREKKDSDEDLVFVKEEPKEYTDNSSCSFGQSPFTLPGNPSGDSSQMYGGPPVGELGQLQEINMQMTNEQAMAINMSGQASTSSSSGGTPADQEVMNDVLVCGLKFDEIVDKMQKDLSEGVSQQVFAKAAITRSSGLLFQVLHDPWKPGFVKHLVGMAEFLLKKKEERFRLYEEAKRMMTEEAQWEALAEKTELAFRNSEKDSRKSPSDINDLSDEPLSLVMDKTSKSAENGNFLNDKSDNSQDGMRYPMLLQRLNEMPMLNLGQASGEEALVIIPNVDIPDIPRPLLMQKIKEKCQDSPTIAQKALYPTLLPHTPRRPPRAVIPNHAKHRLDAIFAEHRYISSEFAAVLSDELNIEFHTVRKYFQNKRARTKSSPYVIKNENNNNISPHRLGIRMHVKVEQEQKKRRKESSGKNEGDFHDEQDSPSDLLTSAMEGSGQEVEGSGQEVEGIDFQSFGLDKDIELLERSSPRLKSAKKSGNKLKGATSVKATKSAVDLTKTRRDSAKTLEDSTKTPEDSKKNADDSKETPEDSTKPSDDSIKNPEDSKKNPEDPKKLLQDSNRSPTDSPKLPLESKKNSVESTKFLLRSSKSLLMSKTKSSAESPKCPVESASESPAEK